MMMCSQDHLALIITVEDVCKHTLVCVCGGATQNVQMKMKQKERERERAITLCNRLRSQERASESNDKWSQPFALPSIVLLGFRHFDSLLTIDIDKRR